MNNLRAGKLARLRQVSHRLLLHKLNRVQHHKIVVMVSPIWPSPWFKLNSVWPSLKRLVSYLLKTVDWTRRCFIYLYRLIYLEIIFYVCILARQSYYVGIHKRMMSTVGDVKPLLTYKVSDVWKSAATSTQFSL